MIRTDEISGMREHILSPPVSRQPLNEVILGVQRSTGGRRCSNQISGRQPEYLEKEVLFWARPQTMSAPSPYPDDDEL